MGRKAGLLPVRNLGQDIAHKVDLAALPRGAKPFLADGGLDPGMGIGDYERCPHHAPGLDFRKKVRHETSDSSNMGSTVRISRELTGLIPQAIISATETTRPSTRTF
jgi:hypothetical protein